MKNYGIKGSATIYQWLTRFEILGIQGLEHCRRKTFYDYSFKIKVIKWQQEHHASYPVTATYFRLKQPMMVLDWERRLIERRLKPSKGRS
ncbi:hypothetical protein M1857_15935 (plasmid) [Lactiplantibacillus plantarum]|nr:hypothetical protein M1857_15935 [Lactiplantibacillus plantarum]